MRTTVIEKYNYEGKLIEKTTITETNDAGKISWTGPGSDADWWRKMSTSHNGYAGCDYKITTTNSAKEALEEMTND